MSDGEHPRRHPPFALPPRQGAQFAGTQVFTDRQRRWHAILPVMDGESNHGSLALGIPSVSQRLRSLVLLVHPPTCLDIRERGDAQSARRAMAPAPAPDEGVLVHVPVGGGPFHHRLDLGPGIEPAPFQRQ